MYNKFKLLSTTQSGTNMNTNQSEANIESKVNDTPII